MSSYVFTILFSMSANAYESGNAPFCIMDDFGNLECYYYTLSSCRSAANYRLNSVCVKK